MILEQGRPANDRERAERERRVYDFLDGLGVSYGRIDHEPVMTMEVCTEIDRVLNATICKNLFLCNRQETAFYLLMMPGDKPFRTKDLSAQIGSARLSFASPAHMERLLGLYPGSVSVLGLLLLRAKLGGRKPYLLKACERFGAPGSKRRKLLLLLSKLRREFLVLPCNFREGGLVRFKLRIFLRVIFRV